MSLPIIAITIGDPSGIGPEVVYKSLKDPSVLKVCKPLVIGSLAYAKKAGFDFSRLSCGLCDITVQGEQTIKPGRISAISGEAAYRYILKAVDLVSYGRAKSIVTAPISKEAIKLAGHAFSGHTELLARLTKTKNFAMLMSAGKMNVVMVTRHTPVSKISRELSKKNIYDTAKIAADYLKDNVGVKSPRVAVLALNPHAGESGLIGSEEHELIIPAVKKLIAAGIDVQGPLPSDSAWQKMKNNRFDLMVAMYHDQAMTGFKILSPERLVNITLGLPFIRTSPGHGTAADIAGKGIADPSSMKEAIVIAAKTC